MFFYSLQTKSELNKVLCSIDTQIEIIQDKMQMINKDLQVLEGKYYYHFLKFVLFYHNNLVFACICLRNTVKIAKL